MADLIGQRVSAKNIEKFDGKFENEAHGCTIVVNQTIQSLKDLSLIGLYIYLSSMPPSWNINVQYIMDHFNIGRDKARSLLSNLVSERLLSVRKQRVQGQFSQPIYRLHLHRYPHPSENQNVDHSQDRSQDHDLDETRASTEFSPETEKPAPVNQGPYKTNIYTKQKENKKLLIDFKGFFRFWELYPKKIAKKKCLAIWQSRGLEDMAEIILEKLQEQIVKDDSWRQGFSPHPSTYLNQDRWEDEIVLPKEELARRQREERIKAAEAIAADRLKAQNQVNRSVPRPPIAKKAPPQRLSALLKSHLQSSDRESRSEIENLGVNLTLEERSDESSA